MTAGKCLTGVVVDLEEDNAFAGTDPHRHVDAECEASLVRPGGADLGGAILTAAKWRVAVADAVSRAGCLVVCVIAHDVLLYVVFCRDRHGFWRRQQEIVGDRRHRILFRDGTPGDTSPGAGKSVY